MARQNKKNMLLFNVHVLAVSLMGSANSFIVNVHSEEEEFEGS